MILQWQFSLLLRAPAPTTSGRHYLERIYTDGGCSHLGFSWIRLRFAGAGPVFTGPSPAAIPALVAGKKVSPATALERVVRQGAPHDIIAGPPRKGVSSIASLEDVETAIAGQLVSPLQ
jgi:hypothetical protein